MSPGKRSPFPQAPWAPAHIDQMRKVVMLRCGPWDSTSMSVVLNTGCILHHQGSFQNDRGLGPSLE